MNPVLRRAVHLLWLSALLAACSTGSEVGSSDEPATPSPASSFVVSGHVGNASLTGAQVRLYDGNWQSVAALTSDATAAYRAEVAGDTPLPVRVLVNEGEDLINAKPAEFEMMAIVREARNQTQQVSPLSTLAAQIQECSGHSAEVADGLWAQTRERFALGLSLATDPLDDAVFVSNAAQLALANEALREIIRRSRQSLRSSGMQVTHHDIIRQLGCDLSADAELNASGPGVDGRLIATVRAAEVGVLLELIAGQLYVEGQDGKTWMNAAIAAVTGSSAVTVADVVATSELIGQSQRAVALFVGEFADPQLAEMAVLLDGEPTEVVAAVAESMDSAHQNTLWGLTDRIALADDTRIDAVIANAARQRGASPPVVSLAASASSVAPGDAVQLSWSSAGANRCVALGAWQGSVDVEGTFQTQPLTLTSNFGLRCIGLGGVTSTRVEVAVLTPQSSPSATLNADAATIDEGESTTLRWSSENATRCAAEGDWAGRKSLTGRESTGALTQTSTFTMTCTGGGLSDSAAVTVVVNPATSPLPIVGMNADRDSVDSGDSVTLSWSSSHANSCRASGAWSDDKTVSGSEGVGPLNSSSTFILTCEGPGGSASTSTHVAVDEVQLPVPVVTISAADNRISSSDGTVLTWSSTDADSCTASGAWRGARQTGGVESTGPLQTTSTFTLTCIGAGGSASSSVTVIAETPTEPTLLLNSTDSLVAAGASATLNWDSTNTTTCTASNGWSGAQSLSGSASVGPITSQQTYTLSCAGPGGSVSSSVVVNVLPELAFSASPANLGPGESTQLAWTGSNVDTCSASGVWSGPRPTSGQEAVAMSATGTLELNCTGPGGNVSRAATVTVTAPAPPPMLSLQAAASTVARGAGTTLTWSAANATSCTAADGWSGDQPASGSAATGPLTQATTFALTCVGANGSVSSSVRVEIAPELSLNATPAIITDGQSTQLNWTASYVNSCTASNGWSGAKGASGSEQIGPLTSDTSFTLNCTGPGGSIGATAAVQVDPDPIAPTVVLQAAEPSVAQGAATALTWNSTAADSCTASGAWSGPRAPSGSENTRSLNADATFVLTCSGSGGSASDSTTVTVAATPTVTLQAAATSVAEGSSTVVTWDSTNADSCSASGAWSGARATSGSQSTGALSADATYTLTCSGAGGDAAATAFVAVIAQPTVTLTAAPSSITAGETTSLTWSANGASACVAGGGWSGARSVSGTETSQALNEDTTFTINCTNSAGSTTASAAVQVTSAPEPTVALTAEETVLDPDGVTTLNWSSQDADSCTASGGWSGNRPTSGSESIGPLSQASTFSLSCSGAGGTALSMVAVDVNGTLLMVWAAPTENVDGSPVSGPISYDIYYGDTPGVYSGHEAVTNGAGTSLALSLPTGTYYLVMTATNSLGEQSAYSNEVAKTSE